MQRSDPSDHQWEAGQAARGGTAWGAALATVGLTLTTGGAALVLGSSAVPELAEIGARLAESGVRSGVVIVGGLVLTGLGIVLGRVSAISGQLRSAEEAMEVTRTLSLSMRHLVERVARLSAELGELRESDRALLHAIRDRSGAEAAGQQADATFRLAASIDRIERTFGEQLSSLSGQLGGRIDHLGLALDGTQDHLRELAASAGGLDERLRRLEELLALAGEPDEEPLEVTVELDPDLDDGDGLPDEEAPHPSSFDWENVRLPERTEESGLGFLDDLDEPETLPPPTQQARPAPLELDPTGDLEPRLDGLTEEGLGLLDALEAEVGPLQGPPAPERLTIDDLPSALPSTSLTPEALDQAWETFERRREEEA